ncbi:MAG: CHAD domain-containing protein [Actinomycetota bacterium]
MARAWDVHGLRRDARFRDAAGRVILTRWREMMSFRDGTLRGEDIEELHAMRVSSRRLRAAMDAFAPAFPPKSFRRHLRVVKEVTDTLGDARDLDVSIEGLERLLPQMTPDERPGIEGLIERYREERRAEDAHIHALFARLEEEGFAAAFERWIRSHTGVDVARLAPSPPEGD